MLSEKLQDIDVLIIDDEPLMQNLVRGVLVSLGFTRITVANSGRKAQNLIAHNRYDFIITDWRMDDLDGIDIINYVRGSKTAPFCRMPIIMLTGNTEAHYVKDAINAGVSAYLIKPFSAEQLVKRIRSIIENPRDFIVSKPFTGPDRRHSDQPPTGGKERRKDKKKK
jgi:two-component system chemotaxis response regulator CheY